MRTLPYAQNIQEQPHKDALSDRQTHTLRTYTRHAAHNTYSYASGHAHALHADKHTCHGKVNRPRMSRPNLGHSQDRRVDKRGREKENCNTRHHQYHSLVVHHPPLLHYYTILPPPPCSCLGVVLGVWVLGVWVIGRGGFGWFWGR